MNRFYLFQKLAPVGVAVLGVIVTTAGSILVAPSAFAQVLGEICYEGSISGIPGSVNCVDKVFDNFSLDALDAAIPALTPGPAIGELTIENDEIFGDFGTYLFAWESTEFLEGTAANNFSYSYDIAINAPDDPNRFFRAIDIDTETDPFSDIVLQKEITVLEALNPTSVGQTRTISSVQGDAEILDISSLEATKLAVEDTLLFGSLGIPNVNGIGVIEAGENSFVQRDGVPVPEPATSVLGFLAISGLGLGLKRKKRLLKAA